MRQSWRCLASLMMVTACGGTASSPGQAQPSASPTGDGGTTGSDAGAGVDGGRCREGDTNHGLCPQGGPGCGLDHYDTCVDGNFVCKPIPGCCYGQTVPQCASSALPFCSGEIYSCPDAFSCGDKTCRGDEICVSANGVADAGVADGGVAPAYYCAALTQTRCGVFRNCACATSAPVGVPMACAVDHCSVDGNGHIEISCTVR